MELIAADPVVIAPIDAHVHLWTRAIDPQPWIDPSSMGAIDRDFTTADLASMLDESSAGSAIVVQSTNSAAETTRLLSGVTERVAGVVGWLDLAGDVPGQLDALPPDLVARLVGIRHLVHIDPDPDWLLRPAVGRGIAALGRARLSFDLVVRSWQLPQALHVIAANPGVTFVLDHLGAPPIGSPDVGEWERAIRRLARHPNVSAKLSGIADSRWQAGSVLDAYRGVIAVALEAFGPGRLMYGSDWPIVELAGGVRRWQEIVRTLTAELSDPEREQLLRSTAATVYGVSVR